MLGIMKKAPDDQLDYDVDFSRWLDDGDTITTADAAVQPTGELTISSVQVHGAVVKVWLAGGKPSASYTVDVKVATTGGRIKETCFKIRLRGC